MTTEKPIAPIDMTRDRVTCPRHGEPFRTQWPKGWIIFSLLLMEYIFKSESVLAECRRIANVADDVKVAPQYIEAVLDITPACCRVPISLLTSAYDECKVGVLKRCKNWKRLGTPYSSTARGGAVVARSHICFDCVIHAMEYLN